MFVTLRAGIHPVYSQATPAEIEAIELVDGLLRVLAALEDGARKPLARLRGVHGDVPHPQRAEVREETGDLRRAAALRQVAHADEAAQEPGVARRRAGVLLPGGAPRPAGHVRRRRARGQVVVGTGELRVLLSVLLLAADAAGLAVRILPEVDHHGGGDGAGASCRPAAPSTSFPRYRSAGFFRADIEKKADLREQSRLKRLMRTPCPSPTPPT